MAHDAPTLIVPWDGRQLPITPRARRCWAMGLGEGWTVCAPLICGAGVAWVSSFYNHASVLFFHADAAPATTGDL